MCECMSVWVCGCVCVCMCACVRVCVSALINVPVSGKTNNNWDGPLLNQLLWLLNTQGCVHMNILCTVVDWLQQALLIMWLYTVCRHKQTHSHSLPMHAMCPLSGSSSSVETTWWRTSLCVCMCLVVCLEVNTIFLPIKERTERGQLQIHGPVPCSAERPVSWKTHSHCTTHTLAHK